MLARVRPCKCIRGFLFACLPPGDLTFQNGYRTFAHKKWPQLQGVICKQCKFHFKLSKLSLTLLSCWSPLCCGLWLCNLKGDLRSINGICFYLSPQTHYRIYYRLCTSSYATRIILLTQRRINQPHKLNLNICVGQIKLYCIQICETDSFCTKCPQQLWGMFTQ